MNIKLTHPDKIYYGEDHITKQDLYHYYDEFKSIILPYVVDRPISFLRCPHDYHQCFYQKHPGEMDLPEGLSSIEIQEKIKRNNYIYISHANGLLQLPQLGVLEIHPWGSKIDAINKPDMLIFDLDPGPGVPWKKVVETALIFRTELSDLKLKSFVKTTGGKGLHVVIPILPEYSWDEIKKFSKSLCEYVAVENQKQYTLNMKKSERKGKIFLDYLRNQKGATAIAPYSTRARVHAPIATPLDWDELTSNIRDTQFKLENISQRLKNLKEDPWRDFFKIRQSLSLDKV